MGILFFTDIIALPTTALQDLACSRCSIDDVSARDVAEHVRQSIGVKTLVLSYNDIGPTGASALAAAVRI